jgi:hypothetical protein
MKVTYLIHLSQDAITFYTDEGDSLGTFVAPEGTNPQTLSELAPLLAIAIQACQHTL